MKDTLIVIPARYSSTRLPAKVLAEIDGKPIIEWVYTACKNAKVGDVLIATENERIVEVAKKFGAKAVLTSPKCQSVSAWRHMRACPWKRIPCCTRFPPRSAITAIISSAILPGYMPGSMPTTPVPALVRIGQNFNGS